MTWPLWFADLLVWSVQVAVVALATGILVRILRIREPGVLLVCWRALIGASLLLPFIEPWKRPEVFSGVGGAWATNVSITASIPTANMPISRGEFFNLTTIAEILGAVIAVGILVRLVMLALGLVKLRQLRRKSTSTNGDASCAAIFEEARALTGGYAEFRLSGKVESPVTFGLERPVILLPEKFLQLDARFQSAIACHELLHVRRRDWAHHLGEEVLRGIFWFHPAILWLVARVRLAREQVVDLEVVRLTAARKTYVEALLEFTGGRKVATIPAPPFLAEQQLVERVALMLKESGMSRRRLIASLSVIGCALAAAAILAVTVFPLRAAPRAAAEAQETQGVPRSAAPILRIVAVKYHGFDGATLNDTTVREQEEYLERFMKDVPRVEMPYDQKKVDEMERLIESFWKEKGVEVEVRSILTPIPNTSSARLIFDVQRYLSAPPKVAQAQEAQAGSEPVVNAESIWTGKVEQGTMYINVRGLGTLALLNGQSVAKIDMAESQAGDIRLGQSAEVYTHKGVVKGHVVQISPQVIAGNRSVFIALDSAVPSGMNPHASVGGTIRIGELKDVVYVGRPDPANIGVTPEGRVVGVIYKIVDNGKEAEQLHVEFGRVNVATIQVLSGLRPGDTIILSNMAPYRGFDHVEIKQ